jgi:hypothetical protein
MKWIGQQVVKKYIKNHIMLIFVIVLVISSVCGADFCDKRKGDIRLIFKTWWQTMFIWIHGVHKFVLFVLGDVIGLHPVSRLRR